MKYQILEALEADVINAISKENPEISDAITLQFKNRTVTGCEIFPRGFYINYEVSGAPPIDGAATVTLGNVQARIRGLKNGMGFALFVKNGYISSLEGYTYEEEFSPSGLDGYELFYE